MAHSITAVKYTCDWRDEHNEICGKTDEFAGSNHHDSAREVGWGSYANAEIRWNYWEAGGRVWFCPTHATVFGYNHGWGGLESYEPPTRPAKDWLRKLFNV